jgi:diguanylate cyclase (GGDEF)-like protein/putative nucleotidyltransferase with HDIG domain
MPDSRVGDCLIMRQLPVFPSRFLLTATFIYAAVFIGMLVLHPGSDKFYTNFHNTYQILPPLFSAVCAFTYALRGKHVSAIFRAAWLLLGVGSLMWAGGQTTWTVYESILQVEEIPYPGPPDIGYLGAYPFLILGVSLLFGSMPVAGRARHLLDSAIAASGVGVMSWYFLVQRLLVAPDTSQAEKLLNAAYPLADVAALFSAIVLTSAATTNRQLRRSVALLAIGIVLLAFADTMFSYYNFKDAYNTGSWFDWGWSFGWLCVGWAALLPLLYPAPIQSEETAAPTPQPSPTAALPNIWSVVSLGFILRVMAPYAVACICFGLVAYDDFSNGSSANTGYISNNVLILGAWLILLVALRQILTLFENQLLTSQLRGLNSTLEQKVVQRTEQLNSLLQLTKAVNSTRLFDKVLEEASRHTIQALQANAAVIWSSGGDRPEMSLPPRAFPDEVRRQHPGLLKFLAAHPPITQAVIVPLSEIANYAPTTPRTTLRGAGLKDEAPTVQTLAGLPGQCLIAPLLWQEKPVGMIAAICWQKSFDEGEPAMLESIAVEVGTALENARLYAAAVDAADRDPVTGLLNHRAVHQRLDEEFHRAQRLERPLSVIMMDLNNFKLFNDTYGHPVGDQVLKRVARALESECRKYDILGRYGGDEFIAILPDTDEPLALVLAQRLSDRMDREGFQRGSDPVTIPISLSFGVANYPADSNNRFELVTIADRNLYTAKLSDSGIMGTTETQRAHRALRTEGSFDVLDAMVTAVDNKDRYTRRHSEDVTEYALWIAEELGYSEATQRVIRIGGLLHDVGKIGVPEDILRKPGRLSDDEYETMKRHTQLGALIVGSVSGMESILDIVKSHHERWDGKGYPDNLAGEDIPLLGRLLAVADSFSAMTTERPYRKALTWEYALNEIRKGIGTQFDPEMAQAFLSAAMKRNSGSGRHADRDGKLPASNGHNTLPRLEPPNPALRLAPQDEPTSDAE